MNNNIEERGEEEVNYSEFHYDIEGKLEELYGLRPEERARFFVEYFSHEQEVNIMTAVLEKVLKKLGLMKIVPKYRIGNFTKTTPPLTITSTDYKNAPDSIIELLRRSENTRVTFFHRYIYNEDDAWMLRMLGDEVVDVLIAMEILSVDFKIEYNESSYSEALKEYDNGNKKFYTKLSTKEST